MPPPAVDVVDLADLRLFRQGIPHAVFARLRSAAPVYGNPGRDPGDRGSGVRIRSGPPARPAMADSRNAASIRVLERIGMRREGVLRSNRFVRDEGVDEVWCGILRSEWQPGRS